jgi:hypothetical protein
MHVLEVLDHDDLRVTRVIIEQSYNRAGYRHFRVDRLLLCRCHQVGSAQVGLSSWAPFFLSSYRDHVYHIERYHDGTVASLLHCTRTALLGHTQTRVDDRQVL